jgi:hypothetical protein
VVVQMVHIKKACERLMHEKEMLIQYGNALTARLGCFDELEGLSAAATIATATADGALPLLALLKRIDDSLTYMSSNPQYADTMAYSVRLRQLQACTAQCLCLLVPLLPTQSVRVLVVPCS